jgi:iron complex outermembrane recepter protein
MNLKPLLLAATALGLALPLTPLMAQAAPAAAADDEIIVTARKRQESILKVPVTTTVLSSALIERANITGLFDVSKKTVGLKLGIASVESGALISIRGFGTTATDPGVDQSVSLNLDGMQLTQGMSYNVGTFDMAQVEVLKGPQALFFGKSSPAGVVSIRTNDPGDRFELIARASYEKEAREMRNELIVSGPLSDTFGVRVAALYDYYGGFFRNKATPDVASGALPLGNKRLGESDSFFIRGTALWKPSSSFSARLKLTYTHDDQRDATVQQFVACPEGTTNLVPFAGSAFATGETCKPDRNGALVGMNPAAFPGMFTNNQGLKPLKGGRPASKTVQKFGSLELNYTPVSAIDLTSLTGYYRLDVDVDYNCYGSGAGAPACMTQKRLERTDFTQELRASSDFSGPRISAARSTSPSAPSIRTAR